MDRSDFTQVISILSETLTLRSPAETFLNLGIAYRHTRDLQKAKDILKEGEARFPKDPRIPTELANVYLDDGDVDGAREALHRALRIDPVNEAAADRIGAVEMSEGEVRTSLKFWNRSGGPIVNDVFHNANVAFGNWTVSEAHAFHRGKMMTFSQWRTTDLRLLETDIFSNVGIDVEPAPLPRQYNAIILTSEKTNDFASVAFGLLKGAPLETAYLDWWNAGNSGISLNSSYRWDYNRRRGELQVHAPIPVAGVLFLNATGLWRSERWDLTRVLRTDAGSNDRLQFNSTGVRVEFKTIPHFRFDFGGGFEYTNRAANGGLSALLADSRNTGKVLFQASVRLADSGYQSRIHVEGSVARKSFLGDLNYSKATVEMNNRFLISRNANTVFSWTLKGGASRGQLSVEEDFVLGVDTHSANLLRAHPAARRGHYGNAPMGTGFALSNMEIERRIAVLPLFNSFNIPYLKIKAQAFLDSGRTFDRARIFKQGTLYVDSGAGLKFETPTHSLNLIYARALHDGHEDRNVLFAYIEKRW